MTDPALRVCIRSASRAGCLPELSSPLGSGKDSKPGPCSRSSLVSRETLSLRMAGMCSLGVTAAERRAQQDEPRGWEGQEPERLRGRPAEIITRDRGPGDTTRARGSWGGGSRLRARTGRTCGCEGRWGQGGCGEVAVGWWARG